MNNADGNLITITVSESDAGVRLDAFLATRLAEHSRATIQRAIAQGDIIVNERTAKSSYKVRPGDVLEIEMPEATPLTALPENIPLNIVYEDDALVVINKPAGMVVHPGAGVSSGTLANALVWHFQELSDNQKADRPGIVHRLDAGTSGLLVVARTDRAHLHLAAQFAERRIRKKYLALVYGTVNKDEGRIEVPIGRDPRQRVRMAVRPAGQGRFALTLFRVLERLPEFTLLDIEIKTGRTHQIRVHLAHIGHPVAGDVTYDRGRSNNLKNRRIRVALETLNRPFLHAAGLGFFHPMTEQWLEFNAPLPAELQSFLAQLRSPETL